MAAALGLMAALKTSGECRKQQQTKAVSVSAWHRWQRRKAKIIMAKIKRGNGNNQSAWLMAA